MWPWSLLSTVKSVFKSWSGVSLEIAVPQHVIFFTWTSVEDPAVLRPLVGLRAELLPAVGQMQWADVIPTHVVDLPFSLFWGKKSIAKPNSSTCLQNLLTNS